ncbi:short-chain dehydrogenase, partial [Streptomyces sp. GC420]|nr:short-chain dehydrogenase [Streptomyces sp. GC420]
MPPVYTPELVARAIRRLVRRPRREKAVGALGRGLVLQARLAPGLTEKLLALKVDRTHFTGEPASDSDGTLYAPPSEADGTHGGWHGTGRSAGRRLTALALAGTAAAGTAGRLRNGTPTRAHA